MSSYMKHDIPETKKYVPPPPEMTIWDGIIAMLLTIGIMIVGWILICKFIVPHIVKHSGG